MRQWQIIVRVSSDGHITAETKGIKGPDCLHSIELLEELLDADTTASAFTPEYNETASITASEVNNELRQS